VKQAASILSGRDCWDRHWEDYAESARTNPAQEFRRELVLGLLCLDGCEIRPRVFEVGSGQGDFAVRLAGEYPAADYLGLELSASGVAIATKKTPGMEFLVWDLLQARVPPQDRRGWASHAVCSEVLEHLDHPEILLENMKAWMAPGCRVIVTVPGGPMSAFDKHIGHRRHYSPADLRQLLERCGYQVSQVHGAGFPFFNLYRMVVIQRGERLQHEVMAEPSWPARAAMFAFRVLFHLNGTRSGWQTVAVARYLG